MSHKTDVVQWLRNVSTGEVDLVRCGICDHLEQMLGAAGSAYSVQTVYIMRFLKYSMERYAKEHGTLKGFPVPHPTLNPMNGYFSHATSSSSMNDTSEYGLSRRKLAEWLANELENSDVEYERISTVAKGRSWYV